MKNVRLNYFLVGTFVLSMVGALLLAISMLTGHSGATDTYFTTYDRVQDIKYGTQIFYEGYPIGQVEEVTPVRENGRMRFRLELSIVEGWTVPDDSVIEIAASSLLAAKSLNIHAGSSPVAYKPGAHLTSREEANLFAAVSSVASQIGDLADNNMRPLIDNLAFTVKTVNEMLKAGGSDIISDVRLVTGELARTTPEITKDLTVFADSLSATGRELESLATRGGKGGVQNIVANVDQASENISALTADLRTTQAKLDQTIQTFDKVVSENQGDINKIIVDTNYTMSRIARSIADITENLEVTTRHFNEFSRQIRQDPSVLIGGRPAVDAPQ